MPIVTCTKIFFRKGYDRKQVVRIKGLLFHGNERRKERKTTSKGQPKNRAKAKQECEEEKERPEMKMETSLMVHDDERKSPENVASIESKNPPVHF